MKQLKMKLKNQKLMTQIGVVLIFLFFVATIGNAGLLYQNNMNSYINEKWEQSLQLANYAKKDLEDTECLEWLVNYWIEHAEELDIVYDNPEQTAKRAEAFNEKYPQYELSHITTEDVAHMSEEAKKAYAEYRYMKLTDDFNRMKRTYHPTYIFCFYPMSDTELFYFVTGTEEGEVRGDDIESIYRLGTISAYDLEHYPVLKRTWDTGEVQNELEQPEKTGPLSGFYHTYVPIIKSGKPICMVGVTLETNTVKKEIQQKILWIEIIEICAFILIGVVVFAVLNLIFMKPVKCLEKGMSEYETDKDSGAVQKKLEDSVSESEIGQLTKRFLKLTVAIDKHVDEIARISSEQQKLKTELSFAADIQLDMLPKEYPVQKEIGLYGSMEPAKEVGGDFYDFFYVDEDHLAILIGDVSGKGVPASLFMVRSMMAIRSYALLGIPVEEVFTRANKELCRGNDSELFTTAWLGIYEISTGKISFTEAGHEDPIWVHKNGEVELVRPKKKKMVLAGFEGVTYISGEFVLEPGDTLLLYTDGLPEANNIEAELYGMERVRESVRSHREIANSDLEAFMKSIREDVYDFVGEAEQFDDLTMLAITRNE